MRALVVYCHPDPESFNAAICDLVCTRLTEAGAELRVLDLYARGFDGALSRTEWRGYLDSPANRVPVKQDAHALEWCDTLIFIYPTWWYGLPAVLKGWLDRVMLPDVAFLMPDGANKTIRPGLTHITRLGVFTTCGASRWLTFLVGAPGKRTLLRGVRLLCARRCRTAFAAHYLMDSSTPESRATHLERVDRALAKLIGAKARQTKGAAA
ncbi:NAD(P)H-dependent oxidoreductase [Seohaeicola saemankumensis]|uniref:NAD(P)H-dependent oxidoreductase n=1 Tax=Seohaeicola saemankumensis TaxID=481181 RepID=UPI001E33F633|nr:NAD(P)H-dependent oxidoreductase [Seohaeicola saemankumensis]MCD1627571.1 NAD(P)H-dependent oxidoreductase [Seohaeicola saemankumensis]